MKHTLQVIAAVLCFTLIFTVFLTGCSKQEQPSDGTSEVPTESKNTPDESQTEPSETSEQPDESQTEPSETTEPVTEPIEEPAEPLDMDTFIQKLAEEYPNASAEELCTEIQKSPFFVLYQFRNIDFSIPGFTRDFKPTGIDDSYAIVHVSTESFVLVFKTKSKSDADKLTSELQKNLNKDWGYNGAENDPDTVFVKAVENTVFFALYHGDIQPITEYAKSPEEYIALFHDYCKKHPNTDCTKMATDLSLLQNFSSLFTNSVNEGRLKGFNRETTISGFSDGAVFCPQVDPSDFLGYVFRVKDGNDVNTFVSQLREKADLAFNVCVVLKNLTVEAEGNYVLFMMYGAE